MSKKNKKQKDKWSPKYELVYTDLQKLSRHVHLQLAAYRKNKRERASEKAAIQQKANVARDEINRRTQLLAAAFAGWNEGYRKLKKKHKDAGEPVLSPAAQRARDQIAPIITELTDAIREAQQS